MQFMVLTTHHHYSHGLNACGCPCPMPASPSSDSCFCPILTSSLLADLLRTMLYDIVYTHSLCGRPLLLFPSIISKTNVSRLLDCNNIIQYATELEQRRNISYWLSLMLDSGMCSYSFQRPLPNMLCKLLAKYRYLLTTVNKKLSYRRETARQLRMRSWRAVSLR